jgi:sensor histidine kinase YesM
MGLAALAVIDRPVERRPGYWLRIAATTVVAAILLTVGGLHLGTPFREGLRAFAMALVFSACITPLAWIIMPRVAPAIRNHLRFPLNWVAHIVVLLGVAITGSLMAVLLLAGVGLVPPHLMTTMFSSAVRVSIVMTLTFGILVSVYEFMRSELEETTLALRTKERDEAEARRLGAEAQLASLESRVQPHFLFNTLNSIAALIPQNPAGAEKMTGQLASLLRSSLDTASSPLVPLEQELAAVRDYLDIERVRFGDRLRYDIQIPQELGRASVPPLSLQTLVENSVKYAVAPRREGGSIWIAAAADGPNLRLEVSDDGPGFDASAMPAGHGLALLRDRLAMTFGARAHISIDCRPGRAAVSIEIADGTSPIAD